MYDLTIIKRNGGAYINSREVAAIIGKRHNDLLIRLLSRWFVKIFLLSPGSGIKKVARVQTSGGLCV